MELQDEPASYHCQLPEVRQMFEESGGADG